MKEILDYIEILRIVKKMLLYIAILYTFMLCCVMLHCKYILNIFKNYVPVISVVFIVRFSVVRSTQLQRD